MGEAGPEVATSLVGKPLRRGSALLFPTEVRGDIQYQLVKEFMPLSMALAIADDRAALPTDLSTLANANLCHGGTSHSCDRFNPGCRPSLASGVEVALLDGAEHEQAPLACRSVGPSHLGVRVIDPCCHDGDHACDHPPLGRPVGFVALRLYADGQTGEIYMLTVDPLVQRQGIGTALTSFAVQQLRDAGMRLAVVGTGGDPGHAPARRVYEKPASSVCPW